MEMAIVIMKIDNCRSIIHEMMVNRHWRAADGLGQFLSQDFPKGRGPSGLFFRGFFLPFFWSLLVSTSDSGQ